MQLELHPEVLRLWLIQVNKHLWPVPSIFPQIGRERNQKTMEKHWKPLKNITRKQRKPLKTIENHWKSFKLPENHWNTFWTSSLKQCVAKYRMEVTKSSTWHHITHLHPGYSHPNEGILFNHWEWLLNNMIMGISVEYSTKRDLTTINTWLYPW